MYPLRPRPTSTRAPRSPVATLPNLISQLICHRTFRKITQRHVWTLPGPVLRSQQKVLGWMRRQQLITLFLAKTRLAYAYFHAYVFLL